MKKKKIISLLFIFSFLLSSLVPLISLPSFETNNTNTNPKTSTNYLFKGTPYTFNLDDFYDDADLTKIWTGAKFQTEDFNGTTLEWSGTIDNDTVTPVNNTETRHASPSGHYNATYSFTEEADDTSGINIKFIDSLAGTTPTTKIVGILDGHKKILYHEDGRAENNFDANYDSFTVEVWSYITGATDNVGLIFKEGTTECLIIKFCQYDGKFEYHNGTDYQEVKAVNSNSWYHHKFIIYSDNTFDWYINGNLEVEGGSTTKNMVNGCNKLQLYSETAGHEFYVDAVGYYPFDPDYNIGENLYPDNINMINGTYDYSDNMKVLDDVYTSFISTVPYGNYYESPHQ